MARAGAPWAARAGAVRDRRKAERHGAARDGRGLVGDGRGGVRRWPPHLKSIFVSAAVDLAGAAAESLAADGDLLRRKVGISRALISL
jgi:hypothetical protein